MTDNTAVIGTLNKVVEAEFNLVAAVGNMNAVNWTDVGQAWVKANGTAGAAMNYTNGSINTTYGVRDSNATDPNAPVAAASGSPTVDNATNITVRAAETSGTNNTLNLAVNNAGAVVTRAGLLPLLNLQTITSLSTGIETISIATAGTNNIRITDNPAAGVTTDYAKVVVTGNGSNSIDVRDLTQAKTYDLSGATGANTLSFVGGLQSNTAITGGTGVDTVRFTPGTVVAGISLTGVEGIRASSAFNAAGTSGTVAFSSSSATTLRMDGDVSQTATVTLINPGAIGTINYVGSGLSAEVNQQIQFNALTMTGAYAGTSDAVAVNISNSGTTNLNGYGIGSINANGVETFAFNATQVGANGIVNFNTLTSNSMQSVAFTSAGAVRGTVAAAPLTGNSNLTSVNLSGVTGNATSVIALADGSVGSATQVIGSSGNGTFSLLTNAQGTVGFTDVLLVQGGTGNTVIYASNATLPANLTDGAWGAASFNGLLNVELTASGMTNAIYVGGTGVGPVANDSTTAITATGVGSVTSVIGNAGVDTITVTATGLGSTNIVRGEAAADIINISASTVPVQLQFTTGRTVDTVTGFSTAKDVVAYDISSLNAAGAVVNSANAGNLASGTSVNVTDTTAVSVQTVSAAAALTAANVLAITGSYADAAAVETALVVGGTRALTTNAGAGLGMAQYDILTATWLDTDGLQRVGVVYFDQTVAANTAIAAADITVVEIATVGANALGAANFTFIA